MAKHRNIGVNDQYREVYSTDSGRLCPGCSKPAKECICASRRKEEVAKGDGTVRVRRETKGRGGKTVTTVTGIPVNQISLSALLKDLKKLCGAGGTLKDHTIEIQGDHCDRLIEYLTAKGFPTKRSGG